MTKFDYTSMNDASLLLCICFNPLQRNVIQIIRYKDNEDALLYSKSEVKIGFNKVSND